MRGIYWLAEDLLTFQEGLCHLGVSLCHVCNEQPLLFWITRDTLFVSGRKEPRILFVCIRVIGRFSDFCLLAVCLETTAGFFLSKSEMKSASCLPFELLQSMARQSYIFPTRGGISDMQCIYVLAYKRAAALLKDLRYFGRSRILFSTLSWVRWDCSHLKSKSGISTEVVSLPTPDYMQANWSPTYL